MFFRAQVFQEITQKWFQICLTSWKNNKCHSSIKFQWYEVIIDYLSTLKMKFSIKDFFSKCDQIRSFLRIWSHLLKKSVMESFIFCAVIMAVMKDSMDMLSSFWRTTCPTWCASYTCNNSKKNNPKKTPICSSEKWVHQKSMDSCFKPRALLCKVSTLASNQLYAGHCSYVIVLLCPAKTQRMQSLMQTLFRSDLKPIIL